MNPTRLHAIMSGEARDVRARLARVAMSCAEPFYRAAVGVRNAMFDWGIRKPKKLPRPVISIGNITTGGTGKTPMVIEIVRRLIEMGQKPAVLLRGYGMDEIFELRSSINELNDAVNGVRRTDAELARMDDRGRELFADAGWGVPIEARSNRYRGGLSALRDSSRISAFVLDDGFQHRQLHRDLSLLLIDAAEPFGYGRVLPRGMLREPAGNAARADAFIITRADYVDAAALRTLDAQVNRLAGKPPVAHAVHSWSGFDVYDQRLIGYHVKPPDRADAPRSREASLDALTTTRVVGACGIGNPDAFRQMLQVHVGELAHLHVFPDHHNYTVADLSRVLNDAIARGAAAIVVTPKDFVKWQRFLPPFSPDSQSLTPPLSDPLPIYRPKVTMRFLDGGDEVDALLRAGLAVGR